MILYPKVYAKCHKADSLLILRVLSLNKSMGRQYMSSPSRSFLPINYKTSLIFYCHGPVNRPTKETHASRIDNYTQYKRGTLMRPDVRNMKEKVQTQEYLFRKILDVGSISLIKFPVYLTWRETIGNQTWRSGRPVCDATN